MNDVDEKFTELLHAIEAAIGDGEAKEGFRLMGSIDGEPPWIVLLTVEPVE